MWHEARKQERLIRTLLVDYRRRAERRKEFYEKIKSDPTQFLQLHGRPCKIHLDPAVAAAGDSPAIMMPWQGDNNSMIDRFDVRAHLDLIPEVRNPDVAVEDLSYDERQLNYERYRILAQNTFLGIGEDKFLQQLEIEEQFGVTVEEKGTQKEKLQEKKGTGAAIGYNYNDPSATVQPITSAGTEASKQEEKESDDDSDLEIIDVDLSIDVNKVEPAQAHELNSVGPSYGMAGSDLFSFLTGDADDAELQKQRVREEKEKAMFSGRKSRRERRAHRDKKLATRVLSPPSYALSSAQGPRELSKTPSRSRSPSPYNAESIQFITSFGGDEEEKTPGPKPPKTLYADKLKQNLESIDTSYAAAVRGKLQAARSQDRYRSPIRMGPHRPPSRSLSRSRSRSRLRSNSPVSSHSLSRSRSRSRSKYRSRSRSRSYDSRSISPRYKRSRSRSYGRRKHSRSHSPTNECSSHARHNSRSMSVDRSPKTSPAKSVVPRYYGRRKEENQSSSEISLDSESSDGEKDAKPAVGVKPNTNQNQLRLTGSSNKGSSRREGGAGGGSTGSRGSGGAGMSIKEKLKRKMQVQLSRQLRADKKAEAERLERENAIQAQRDEEMRELAIKLRRRHREMRHQRERSSSGSDSDKSLSSSNKGTPEHDAEKKTDEKVSRSRSATPEPKKISVWQSGPSSAQPPIPGVSRPQEENAYRSRDQFHKSHNRNYDAESFQRVAESEQRYEMFEKPHMGRPPPINPSKSEYDDSWEREISFRGRGNLRRPYGNFRGNYRRPYQVQPEGNYGSNSGKNDISYGGSSVRNDVGYGGSSGRNDGSYGGSSGRNEGSYGGSSGRNDSSYGGSSGRHDVDYGGSSGRNDGSYGGSSGRNDGSYGGSSEGRNDDYGRKKYDGSYNESKNHGSNNYNSSRNYNDGANFNSRNSEHYNRGGTYSRGGYNRGGQHYNDSGSYSGRREYNDHRKDRSYNEGNNGSHQGPNKKEGSDSRRDPAPPSKVRKLVDY